jgi:hypothetical protein
MESNSKVIVTADKAGNVIVRSQTNLTFGHIRVEQSRVVVDENGFAKRKTISALVPGTLNDLKSLEWEAGQEIEGKIIIRERFVPFNRRNPSRDLKIAGYSGVICTKEGNPIYRKHFYTLDENSKDSLIEHDNNEEIKSAYDDFERSQLETAEKEINSYETIEFNSL